MQAKAEHMHCALAGAKSDKALYKLAENKQRGKKAEIIGGEFRDIPPGPVGVMRGVLTEGYKACKGGDKRAGAAYVYPHKQLAPVIGELRQQYCGGDIAYELAGQCAYKQGIPFKKGGKEGAHCLDAGHIACKYKEENKG